MSLLNTGAKQAGLSHCIYEPPEANTKYCKVKGKAIPLQAWTDPVGSRMLRLPDFKTIGT